MRGMHGDVVDIAYHLGEGGPKNNGIEADKYLTQAQRFSRMRSIIREQLDVTLQKSTATKADKLKSKK